MTRPEWLDRNKHSSLLLIFVDYGFKKFYNIVPSQTVSLIITNITFPSHQKLVFEIFRFKSTWVKREASCFNGGCCSTECSLKNAFFLLLQRSQSNAQNYNKPLCHFFTINLLKNENWKFRIFFLSLFPLKYESCFSVFLVAITFGQMANVMLETLS